LKVFLPLLVPLAIFRFAKYLYYHNKLLRKVDSICITLALNLSDDMLAVIPKSLLDFSTL
jgi:hypothetical protein